MSVDKAVNTLGHALVADALSSTTATSLREIADLLDVGGLNIPPRARFYLVVESLHDAPEVFSRHKYYEPDRQAFLEAAITAMRKDDT
jgi:hypothetical protein